MRIVARSRLQRSEICVFQVGELPEMYNRETLEYQDQQQLNRLSEIVSQKNKSGCSAIGHRERNNSLTCALTWPVFMSAKTFGFVNGQ